MTVRIAEGDYFNFGS